MASYVVQSCLIEDPTLFLRHLFDKLSGKEENKNETAITLRILPSLLGKLSPHVAHAIFANVVSYRTILFCCIVFKEIDLKFAFLSTAWDNDQGGTVLDPWLRQKYYFLHRCSDFDLSIR